MPYKDYQKRLAHQREYERKKRAEPQTSEQIKRRRAQGRKDAKKFREKNPMRALELTTNAYYRHRETRIEGVMRRIAVNRAWVETIKAEPCTDCGVCYPPCVMDFDHVRGKKSANISRMLSRDVGGNAIADEIAKCDLVCSNCHRIRTWIKRKPTGGCPRKTNPLDEEKERDE
jgi:hypothetical protein